jgi:SAM-dependent methyltransferase
MAATRTPWGPWSGKSVARSHHWTDREAGLAELYRVLRPGGRLLLAERLARRGGWFRHHALTGQQPRTWPVEPGAPASPPSGRIATAAVATTRGGHGQRPAA